MVAQNTDFGKAIKKRLIDMGRSNQWLCGEVSKHTGLFFDDSYLSKLCRGVYVNPKIAAAIKEILKIEEDA